MLERGQADLISSYLFLVVSGLICLFLLFFASFFLVFDASRYVGWGSVYALWDRQ